MAECTTAEVRQYFIGQQRSLNVEQPPSPASTLSPPPSSSSELTELSETFTSAATPDGLSSNTDSQQSHINEVVQNSESISDISIKENQKPKARRKSKKNSPSIQAVNLLERPKRKVVSKRKLFASSDNEESSDSKRHKSDVKSKTRTVLTSTEPIYPNDVPGDQHIQTRRCMNAMYGEFERCSSCLAKKTDTCRFVNFRIFGTRKNQDPENSEENELVYGPKFQSITEPDPPGLYEFKETTDEQQGHILDMIGPTFKKILQKEIPHFEYANIRKIPNREICQLCDSCETTIFSGYWMCCVCGKEICLSCYDEWDVSKKSKTIVCSFRRSHNKEQMLPIYHYNKDIILRLLKETEQRMNDYEDMMDIDEWEHELTEVIPELHDNVNITPELPLSTIRPHDPPQQPHDSHQKIECKDEPTEEIFELHDNVNITPELPLSTIRPHDRPQQPHDSHQKIECKNEPTEEIFEFHNNVNIISELPLATIRPHDRPQQPHDSYQKIECKDELTEEIFELHDNVNITPELPLATIRPHDRSQQPHDSHQKIECKDELNEEIFELHDNVNITPELHDNVNITPELHDIVNIKPELHDIVNIKPELHDNVNITPELHDNVNITPELHDNVNITPELPLATIRPHDRPQQPHDSHQKIEWKEDELTEEIFKDFWKKGYPFLLKETSNRLSNELWTPKYFKTKYGEIKCGCVDCKTGLTHSMDVQKFFDGFEDINARFKRRGKYPCLKLKDWPSTDDFADVFPNHFQDFMNALPFKEYTTRQGVLNLANRLPTDINRPDLGPKMYNAYGSEDSDGGNGTTNLHLDMTDAVNMMAYAPNVENRLEHEQLKPSAAVWDIYHFSDLPRLRRFLRKVAKERGLLIDHPIHDQCFYMDSTLRKRLLEEEGVSGWRIYQNPGDVVFVPAGCAHQVCNYTSCIKVAVDFVSPEGVARSYIISNQFRKLTHNHKRKKDILQLPVILYHSWTTSYTKQ
ncbi:Clavaminate synthase-like protein [Gigaspora margarita]|nr:Clavaminate synthase-like protein [Gigaspora margarita]